MLMTKYTYFVHEGRDGYLHSVVTRLSDGAEKYFFQCGGSKAGLEKFFESMTDELTEGYFPKAGKKGGDVDNWAFRGFSLDRLEAYALARLKIFIANWKPVDQR